ALGHAAVVADMAGADHQQQLNAALQPLPDCVFGFGGVGVDLRGQAGSTYDALGIVYASMHVDHPIHHLARIATPVRRNVGLFLDRSHLEFLDAAGLADGFSQLGFLPPGANELPEPPDLSDEAFARRDIPLMFTGTYRGAPQAYWRDWPEGPSKTVAAGL